MQLSSMKENIGIFDKHFSCSINTFSPIVDTISLF